MNLNTSVIKLNRIGKALQSRLKRLGILNVNDLIYYFPFRYEDYSRTIKIADLKNGDQVTIKGKVELIDNKRSPRTRRIITEAVVADESERVQAVWFGQPFLIKNLRAGDSVYLSGKVTDSMFGMRMISPSYEKAKNESVHTARIVPIYSLTSGITQKQLRFLISQVIDYVEKIEDWLPGEILQKLGLLSLHEALRSIHFPEDAGRLEKAEFRLKFDELFILQLRAEMMRQSIKKDKATSIKFKKRPIRVFVDGLPFTLTDAQKVAAWEILRDLQQTCPMNRMLEGDVGSGKTVVAAMAIYSTALNGLQTAMMAPTEILAKQHYDSLCSLLGKNLSVGLLTREYALINNMNEKQKTKAADRRKKLEMIKQGKVDLLVGTHALLVDEVKFKDLGLVIVDEQHRFGVEQRKKIKHQSGNKETMPHFLSMTATPIPRSFALTLYGDLDISIISQLPKGRKAIITRLVEPNLRHKAYDFIKEQVKQGRQVFVVCPLIEENQGQADARSLHFGDEKKSVMNEYDKLKKEIFPDLRIGYLHGKMEAKEKEQSMNKFVQGEIDVLVSTSVIEVGVDVPNASVMIIEGSERFGLAQLHQFRGRVGRSSHQSYCFLFSDSDSDKAEQRLKYFVGTTNGFKLAEYDLQLRGPGDVYGLAQSGMMNFRLASMKDSELIKLARNTARDIDFTKYPGLNKKVEEWEKTMHLE